MGIQERREREKELRRNAIIDAAEEVFVERGFTGATIDQIAKKAELAKGTIYLYFKSKEGLLLAVYLKLMDIIEEKILDDMDKEETGIGKLKSLKKISADSVKSMKKYAAFDKYVVAFATDFDRENPLLKELLQKRDRLLNSIVHAIELGMEDGTVRKDLNPLKAAIFISLMMKGITWAVMSREDLLRQQFQIEYSEMIDSAFSMIEDSLKP